MTAPSKKTYIKTIGIDFRVYKSLEDGLVLFDIIQDYNKRRGTPLAKLLNTIISKHDETISKNLLQHVDTRYKSEHFINYFDIKREADVYRILENLPFFKIEHSVPYLRVFNLNVKDESQCEIYEKIKDLSRINVALFVYEQIKQYVVLQKTTQYFNASTRILFNELKLLHQNKETEYLKNLISSIISYLDSNALSAVSYSFQKDAIPGNTKTDELNKLFGYNK